MQGEAKQYAKPDTGKDRNFCQIRKKTDDKKNQEFFVDSHRHSGGGYFFICGEDPLRSRETIDDPAVVLPDPAGDANDLLHIMEHEDDREQPYVFTHRFQAPSIYGLHPGMK